MDKTHDKIDVETQDVEISDKTPVIIKATFTNKPLLAAFAIFIFIGLFVYFFSGVLMPFVLGGALGYLLNPIANRLEKLGLSRLQATFVILAAFIIFIALFGLVTIPILIRQVSDFIASAPQSLSKLEQLWTQESQKFMHSWPGDYLQKLGLSGPEATIELPKSMGDFVSEILSWLGSVMKSLLSGGAAFVGLVSLLVITPVVAFYMLLDWDKMLATIKSLIPPRFRSETHVLAHQIDVALSGFLRGQSLVCLFLGLWYAIGLTAVGLNFGFLIGITAGVLSFIPYVGSATALVLSSIAAIVQGWPEWKLLAMSLGVVLVGQFLEGNVLSPKLVGASVGLHPVWIMFALMAFGSLFGFTGLLIAVPVSAALGVLLRFALKQYRKTPYYNQPDAENGMES